LYFDEAGNLLIQEYYKFGLRDSIWLGWDSRGEISSKTIYKNGVQTYIKQKLEDGRSWEAYSSITKPNYIYREYTDKNILSVERKNISSNPPVDEMVEYFPNTKIIQKHSYALWLYPYGEFKEYSISGKLIGKGSYDKKYYQLELKSGLWLVYNESLNRMDSIRYKISDNIIDSSGTRLVGSLVFLPESKEWVKDGDWHYLDINGSVKKNMTFNSDLIEKISEKNNTDINSETLSNKIKITKTESGLIEVPVVLNDVLRINFIFDSGASEVSISPDVAMTLIRAKTVTESDFLPDQTYTFADGSTAKSKRFLIKKLIIGNQTLTNIEASISNSIEAPMLIGQNVMNKLGSVTIDYDNQLLIIKNK
jgi:aspartyl protease family protein